MMGGVGWGVGGGGGAKLKLVPLYLGLEREGGGVEQSFTLSSAFIFAPHSFMKLNFLIYRKKKTKNLNN